MWGMGSEGMAGGNKKETLGQQVSSFIEGHLDRLLADPDAAAELASSRRPALPPAIADKLDHVMALAQPSYRDAIIIQLGYGLVSADGLDLTKRAEGGRGVAQRLGSLLASRHIRGVADAYQNIGKNTDELCRGNQPDFDDALRWADAASREERRAAFDYVLASVSLTARPVLPMPDIDRGKLTFYRVAKFLDALLKIPSGGAHQQFAVAAFVDALIEEFGVGGPGGLRVATKRINASDASSKTAGDIQILRGNRVEEAFEVTANQWPEKIESAKKSLKDADLQRAHIIAAVGKGFIEEAAELGEANIDLSVIDVDVLLRTLTAIMRKPAREAALARLYDLLERYQPDIERVNAYVRLLQEHELAG